MPAFAADIIRATRQARVITREDAAILKLFPAARDASKTPDAGYFEVAEHAAAALELKARLMGRYLRRYVVSVASEVLLDPFDGIPTARLIDPEIGTDIDALLTRLQTNMQDETSQIEALG